MFRHPLKRTGFFLCMGLLLWQAACLGAPWAFAKEASGQSLYRITADAVLPKDRMPQPKFDTFLLAQNGQTKSSPAARVNDTEGRVSDGKKRVNGDEKRRTGNGKRVSGTEKKGFSSNPFALDRKPQKQKKQRIVYGSGGVKKVSGAASAHTPTTKQTSAKKSTAAATGSSQASSQNKLSVSSETPQVKGDRLEAQPRATFSGGEHTLSHMDSSDPTTEISLQYQHDDSTATRVVLNPQDEASPLYRPMDQDGAVNSAGVYMDIKVQPNVLLQVGGEYCELDADKKAENNSKGAAVGLKWQF